MLAVLSLAVLAAASPPDGTLVADLEGRLSASGATAVNASLVSASATAMRQLNGRTASCDLQAVSLSIRLSRAGSAKAVEAHRESLRLAVGHCTGFVLALLTPDEIPRVCASIESWTVMQTVRELRRRIGAIEANEVLHASQRGKACRAAYIYEMQNTRVGLTTRRPATAGPSP